MTAGERPRTSIWAAIASVLAVILGLMAAIVGTAVSAAAAEAPPPAGALIVNNLSSTDPGALPSACALPNYPTITAAVGAASPGSSIYVCAGTYHEAVSINKPLGLFGAQAGMPTSGRTNPADETVVNANPNTGSDFTYTGTSTSGSINGFTLLGNGAASNSPANYGISATNGGPGYAWSYNIIQGAQDGIFFDATGALPTTITNNKITGNNEAAPSASGIGVWFSGQANNVTIAGNVFGNGYIDVYTATGSALSTGLVVNGNTSMNTPYSIVPGWTSGAQVTGNTILGSGSVGILLWGDDVSPMVTGNNVSNGSGVGIQVYDGFGPASTGVTIKSNTVSHLSTGINLFTNNPLSNTSSVTGNTVTSSSGDGILVQVGTGVQVTKNMSTLSAAKDCHDTTTGGSGPGGVTNTWTGDIGATSNPSGICLNASSYTPMTPTRICDTRSGNPSGLLPPADQCNTHGVLPAGGTLTINVGGTSVPANASAAVLNVTSVGASADGFVTAYPAGAPVPNTSNLNVTKNGIVANLVTVALGTGGKVSFTSNVSTDLVVDLEGFFTTGPAADQYQPASPRRVCDTRAGNPSGLNTAPANQCNGHTLAAGGKQTISLSGLVPTGTNAVVANVTAVNPASGGFLTVYPSDQPQPTASNVNFNAGQTLPNRVSVPVGSADAITVYSNVPTDIIVDIGGTYSNPGTAGSLFLPQNPQRICDTRVANPSGLTPPADQCNNMTMVSGGTQTVKVAGQFGVLGDATAATLNVTAIRPTAPTYLTVFPHGTAMPTASDLNPVPAQIEPNMTITSLAGTPGSFDVFNHTGSVDMLADLEGWYGPVADFGPGA